MALWGKQKTIQAQQQVPVPQIAKVERIDNFAGLKSSPEQLPFYLMSMKQEDLPKVGIVLTLEETLEEKDGTLFAKEFVLFPIEDMFKTKDGFEINTQTAELLGELPQLIAQSFKDAFRGGWTIHYAGRRFCDISDSEHTDFCNTLSRDQFFRFLSKSGTETFRNKNGILVLETNTQYEKHGDKTHTLTSYSITPAMQLALERSGLGVAAVTFPTQTSLHNILHKYEQRSDPDIKIVFPKTLADKYKPQLQIVSQ